MLDAVALLRDLVSTQSVNGTAGELAIARKITALLQAEGLPAECMPLDGQRANVTLFLPGRENGKTIVWNGHLDTVEWGDPSAWTYAPTQPEIRDNLLYGRGSSDMKAGLAAMLYCLIDWKRKARRPNYNLFFCATCDEERNGCGAEALLTRHEVRSADAFIISEPTALDVCAAEKGCLWLKLRVGGKTSHAAYPDQGCNAAAYVFEYVQELKRAVSEYRHPLLGASSVEITGIHAGIANNMIPDSAEAVLDMRVTPDLSPAALDRILQESADRITLKAGGNLSLQFQKKNERIPLALPEDSFWAREIKKAARSLGLSCKSCGINFFSDASVFARANPRAEMVIWGPGEAHMAHQADEYVRLDRYREYIRLLNCIFAEA